jgi:hypothetical protein
MKTNKLLLIICIICFYSCKENCIECTDNISAENKKIPYQNKELVAFKNDTLGVVFDTVYVNLGFLPDCYKKESYQTYEDLCGMSTFFKYSNKGFLTIDQGSNQFFNEIWIYFSDYSLFNIMQSDTLEMTFNNKLFHVNHYFFPTDTLGSPIWTHSLSKDSTFVYNDYYFAINPEIKLLQYTTVYRDGTRRVWRLQE